MPLRALTAISVLYIMVDVGLVLGLSAATTPIGQPISMMPLALSSAMTPTVLISLIDCHTTRLLRWFFSILCSAIP